jgi:5-methylcytosine-specific restriction endonuclease McrA
MNSLKSLSDKKLVGRLRQLVLKERATTLSILPHLAEVARRQLYVAKGYSTLFDYCVSELGYGESSAWRRVRVARVIKEIPEVYDLLKQDKLTFSAVDQVATVLTVENKKDLLPRLMGKSKSEIDKLLAEYRPPQKIRDQARPTTVSKMVTVESLPAGALSTSDGGRQTSPDLGEISLRSEGKKDPSCSRRMLQTPASDGSFSTPELIEVHEKMYEIRFAGDEELMELMGWMRTHLSHKFPTGASFLDMFKYAMQYVREREDLALRAERRNDKKRSRKPSDSSSRHIPATVKEKVWVRDKGQCTFVGSGGKRCSEIKYLQFDHFPIPFGRGGPSTPDNLRLLCATHNKYTARQVYGERHMEQFGPRRE